MTFSLRLPTSLAMRLEHLAITTGRTKKFYMMEDLEKYIDDLEDIYLSEKRLEDSRAGRTKSYSLEEIMQEFDMKSDSKIK